LRLHKYTGRLAGLAYEELLALNEDRLLAMDITAGAVGKLLKHLTAVKEREATLSKLNCVLESISAIKDLLGLFADLEKLLLMPLKLPAPTVEANALFSLMERTFFVLICRQREDYDRYRIVSSFFRW